MYRGICHFDTPFLSFREVRAENWTLSAQRSVVKAGSLLSAPSSLLDPRIPVLPAQNVPITHSFNKHPGAARPWAPWYRDERPVSVLGTGSGGRDKTPSDISHTPWKICILRETRTRTCFTPGLNLKPPIGGLSEGDIHEFKSSFPLRPYQTAPCRLLP